MKYWICLHCGRPVRPTTYGQQGLVHMGGLRECDVPPPTATARWNSDGSWMEASGDAIDAELRRLTEGGER